MFENCQYFTFSSYQQVMLQLKLIPFFHSPTQILIAQNPAI